MKYLLPVLFLFTTVSAHAHLHKSEKAVAYVFIFQNKDTLRLTNPSDSLLNACNQYVLDHRKKLLQADLTFKGGETLTFTADKKKWTSIKISDSQYQIAVPDSTVQKIAEIHFGSVALVWSGTESRPFGTGYFYIRFDTGTQKEFNRYPWLNLIMANYKYSKAVIWRPTGEQSKISADF